MEQRNPFHDLVSPFNIIFSCVICQRTIADVYPNAMLSSDPSEGRLERPCRMWMTECGHLACSEHFEGGGIPFHPHGEDPSAPCPGCSQEKGDNQPKRLYAVFGPGPKDHDSRLPAEWFQTPPMKLDDSTAQVSALRFQYMALIRYGVKTHERLNRLKSSFISVNAEARKLSEDLRAVELEKVALKERIETLKGYEHKYLEWRKKRPEYHHYLAMFSGLANEHAQLKAQLDALGYHVPQTNWSINPQGSGSGHATKAATNVSTSRIDDEEPRKRRSEHHEGHRGHQAPIISRQAPTPIPYHELHGNVNAGYSGGFSRKHAREDVEEIYSYPGQNRNDRNDLAILHTSRLNPPQAQYVSSTSSLNGRRPVDQRVPSSHYPKRDRKRSELEPFRYDARPQLADSDPKSDRIDLEKQRPNYAPTSHEYLKTTDTFPVTHVFSHSHPAGRVPGADIHDEGYSPEYVSQAEHDRQHEPDRHLYSYPPDRTNERNDISTPFFEPFDRSGHESYTARHTQGVDLPERYEISQNSRPKHGVGYSYQMPAPSVYAHKSSEVEGSSIRGLRRNVGRNLNALSFINDPYTTHNQPMSRNMASQRLMSGHGYAHHSSTKHASSVFSYPIEAHEKPRNRVMSGALTGVRRSEPAPVYQHSQKRKPGPGYPSSVMGLPTPADTIRSRGLSTSLAKGPLQLGARSSRGNFSSSGAHRVRRRLMR